MGGFHITFLEIFQIREKDSSILRNFRFPNFRGYKKGTLTCTSNHMFKREIWDKFTEFTFLKF